MDEDPKVNPLEFYTQNSVVHVMLKNMLKTSGISKGMIPVIACDTCGTSFENVLLVNLDGFSPSRFDLLPGCLLASPRQLAISDPSILSSS